VGIEETTTKIDEMLEKIEGLETGLQEKEKEVAEVGSSTIFNFKSKSKRISLRMRISEFSRMN
jgi:archaellum component FlaC